MTENTKTISFVGAAIALVVVTILMFIVAQPAQMGEFEKVGEEFYPEYKDPDSISTLGIFTVDKDGIAEQFVIKKIEGVWRIPTHHNYPVDADERLAEGATALIGLMRENLAGLGDSKHDIFGVRDPKSIDPQITIQPASIGKRITMLNDDGETVFDLIIGNQTNLEHPRSDPTTGGTTGVPGLSYFVRRPDEKETYRTKLKIDLSTKFADWINTRLLNIDASQISAMELNRYQLIEKRIQQNNQTIIQNDKIDGEVLQLNRSAEDVNWNLLDIASEGEAIDQSFANRLAHNFTKLQIKGVLPKFTYGGQQVLTPELMIMLPADIVESNREKMGAILEALRDDMGSKGFALDQVPDTQDLHLVSTRGELVVKTDSGIVYSLNFGEAFLADDEAVQIGGSSKAGQNKATKVGEKPPPESQNQNSNDRNRYLMIRVSFDESLLGVKPVKPQSPIQPDEPKGYGDWLSKQKDAANSESSDETESQNEDAPKLPGDIQNTISEEDERFRNYQNEMKGYLNELNTLDERKATYRKTGRAYRKLLRDGHTKMVELNERFGAWYYVIADDAFTGLQVSRDELVVRSENKAATPESTDGDHSSKLVPKPFNNWLQSRPSIEMNLDSPDE